MLRGTSTVAVSPPPEALVSTPLRQKRVKLFLIDKGRGQSPRGSVRQCPLRHKHFNRLCVPSG